jgi:hypothetical protein
MNEFDCAGWPIQCVLGGTDGNSGSVTQQRSDALATTQRGIAHGVVQALRDAIGCGQTFCQGRFRTLLDLRHPG